MKEVGGEEYGVEGVQCRRPLGHSHSNSHSHSHSCHHLASRMPELCCGRSQRRRSPPRWPAWRDRGRVGQGG